ncbi:hypothetical protein SLA2020_522750 [Shorea laevis]
MAPGRISSALIQLGISLLVQLSCSLRLNGVESSHSIDEMGCEGCGFMESTRSCYEFMCQAEGSWLLKIAYLVAIAPYVYIIYACYC